MHRTVSGWLCACFGENSVYRVWNGAGAVVIFCLMLRFFLSLPFPLNISFSYFSVARNIWLFESELQHTVCGCIYSPRVYVGKKSFGYFESETLSTHTASTYKWVPFFKWHSQSSVCHYSVRFSRVISFVHYKHTQKKTKRNKITVDVIEIIFSNSFKFISNSFIFLRLRKNCFVFFDNIFWRNANEIEPVWNCKILFSRRR